MKRRASSRACSIEALGESEARVRVTSSLENDENVLLALRPVAKPDRDMPSESLPHALAAVDVETSSAADYDQIFSTGGAR